MPSALGIFRGKFIFHLQLRKACGLFGAAFFTGRVGAFRCCFSLRPLLGKMQYRTDRSLSGIALIKNSISAIYAQSEAEGISDRQAFSFFPPFSFQSSQA